MNYILYLAVGNNRTIQEEISMSLLSLQKVSNGGNLKILIYTDHRFEVSNQCSLDIEFKILNSEVISEWLSTSKFMMVLKPRIMQDFFLDHIGNAMLVDSDTFFIEDPAPLFEEIKKGNCVMHLKENKLMKRASLRNYLSKKTFRTTFHESYVISKHTEMWNAGVVGLNNHNSSLLDEVIFLIDQMYKEKKWHTIEQVSFSFFLQKNGNIIPADNYIFHYWFFRPTSVLLKHYFAEPQTETDQTSVDDLINNGIISRKMQFDQLPISVMRLLNYYSSLSDWHLYCLPKNTHVGRLLREEFVKNYDSRTFMLMSNIRDWFNLSNIREVDRPLFIYE